MDQWSCSQPAPVSWSDQGVPAVAQVFGASATALYGINLLLNPVPPEQYKLHPDPSTEKKQKKAEKQQKQPAKQKRRWWRRKGKGNPKEAAESSEASDADTGNDSKVRRPALS
jgi:hypothetical protein